MLKNHEKKLLKGNRTLVWFTERAIVLYTINGVCIRCYWVVRAAFQINLFRFAMRGTIISRQYHSSHYSKQTDS